MKIGLARSFIYYIDGLEWESFFEILGHEVVQSSQSKEGLLDLGQRYCNNDACLPVKHYFGHVLELSGKVDRLFIPQLVSLKKGGNCCPKVIAIPLLVKNSVSHLFDILSLSLDENHRALTRLNVAKLACKLSKDPARIARAIAHVMDRFASLPIPLQGDPTPPSGKAIGLLGHPYAMKDSALNLDLIERIRRQGYRVVVPNPQIDLEAASADFGSAFGCKKVHWDCGQRLVNTAGHYLQDEAIAGVINVTFFACGIDAFVEEVYKQRLCLEKPYLTLTFDEHTGEAGLLTRLEAFFDMLARRS